MDIMTANTTGLSLVMDAMGLASAAGLGLIFANLRYAASRFELIPSDVDYALVSALSTARSLAYESDATPALIALIEDAMDVAYTLDTDDFAP